MSNPRAACDPVEGFDRPSKLWIIEYAQYNDDQYLFW